MPWPIVLDAPSAIELIMCIGCVVLGLSHVLQPDMWHAYFASLRQQGVAGLVTKTMSLELWPALSIVALHPVWSGPGIILTVFGWLLLAKCTISLLVPQIGLRSMALSRDNPRVFVPAGLALIAVGVSSGLALVWR